MCFCSVLTQDFRIKMCVCLPVAALILQRECKQNKFESVFLKCLLFLWRHFFVCKFDCSSLTPHCCALSLSLSPLPLTLSLSPPIPSLSTPLTLPVPSSYPASQVTMTGGFLAPISWSFSARLCVIVRAFAYVFMSVRLPLVLSCVLVPASWQRGATQQPICDWAGVWGS